MESEVKIKKKGGNTETVKYGPQEKYDAQNTVQIKLKLNKKTDADILDWLNSLDNKQGAIKEVIRIHLMQNSGLKNRDADPDKVISQLKPSVPAMLTKHENINCK